MKNKKITTLLIFAISFLIGRYIFKNWDPLKEIISGLF